MFGRAAVRRGRTDLLAEGLGRALGRAVAAQLEARVVRVRGCGDVAVVAVVAVEARARLIRYFAFVFRAEEEGLGRDQRDDGEHRAEAAEYNPKDEHLGCGQ